ncbi:Pr6Pr family membrane protein [Pseudoroseicyclus sp. H15]
MSRLAQPAAVLTCLLFLGVTLFDIVPAFAEGVPGEALWRRARYFTDLTIWMGLGAFTWMAVVGRPLSRGFGAGLVLWLAIVGVVFFTILGGGNATGYWAAVTFIQHAVLPIAAALWWLAFARKAGLRWRAAAVWLVWPALYLAYVLVRGGLDGLWPYSFVNVVELGWTGSLRNMALFFGAFWIAGLALVALARMLGGLQRR